MTPQFWGAFLPAPDAQDTSAMVAANRYTVDLFEVGGGVARVFEGGDRLEIALASYQSALVKHPDELRQCFPMVRARASGTSVQAFAGRYRLVEEDVQTFECSAVVLVLSLTTPGQCLGADAMAHAC